MIEVREGDCVDVLAAMPEHSIDAVVCDPPYGLEFMGKEWDRLDGSVLDDPAEVGGFQDGAGGNPYSRSRIRYGRTTGGGTVAEVNDTEWDGREDSFPFGGGGQRVRYGSGGAEMQAWHERWLTEALRVLKPGGWLLAFSGTRTYHRLACAAEDAGFEVRDMIDWLYGSGFPKSMDVAKAIDAHVGVDGTFGGPKSDAHAGWIERGRMRAPADTTEGHEGWRHPWEDDPDAVDRNAREYLPGSEEAARWAGWGTALKPGHEPILVARKPIERSVAANVLAYGTGALNIDGARIAVPDRAQYEANFVPWQTHERGDDGVMATGSPTGMNRPGRLGVSAVGSGRFPANVILTHDPECEQVGWRAVTTGTAVTRNLPDEGAQLGAVPIAPRTQRAPDTTFAQDGNQETIPEYRCVPGCPVAELDAQSGEAAPKAGRTGRRGGNGFGFYDDAVSAAGTGTWPDDPGGGASRFFKVADYVEGDAWIPDPASSAAASSPQPARADGSAPRGAATEASPAASSPTDSPTRSPAPSTSGTPNASAPQPASDTTPTHPDNSPATPPDEHTPTPNPVSGAEHPTPTGTTTTTTPQPTSDGFADPVTSASTPNASGPGAVASFEGEPPFRYVAKTSTRERNLGLAGFPEVFSPTMGNGIGEREHDPADPRAYARNHHPTVKPVELMRYLVRLVTPPGGTVCDPFLGSGTTAIACVLDGFSCIGIEREPEYVTIARARIEHARQSPRSWEADAAPAPKVRTKGDGWQQESML